MLIKSRNFTPNKTERTFEEGGGYGWAPGQEKTFKGRVINTIRYSKNYSLMKGNCRKCDKLSKNGLPSRGTNGEHCSLPINEHCQK